MNIVFVIDQVYLHGGIERVLSIKANYLASMKGNHITIITTEQKQNKPCYKFNENIIFIDLGINYNRKISYFHPKNLIKLPKHIYKTKSILKSVKPDVVVVCSHSVDTYFIPFINKSIPKVKEFHFSKSIEIFHRDKSNKSGKRHFLKFADYVESKYDKLVVLNKDEAAYYKSNNTVIIANPLTFYPKEVSNVTEPVVITAGRIAKVKRFDILIDIWEMVFKENKNWQLHIYGSGDNNYINTLKQKISVKKLEKNVFLHGPTDQIKKKMLSSSFFVMTSDNECFPLVLLEAQACGLPIIAFDCPNGPRNIISTDNGKLIEPGDNVGFSDSILTMISDLKTRKQLGKNARLNATKFSVDTIMKQWSEMFQELTEKQ